MKAEGSSIVTNVLPKVKVKEEKKECNYQQQQQGSPSTTSSEHSTPTIINTTSCPTTTTTTIQPTIISTNPITKKDTILSINSLNSSVISQIATSATSTENINEPVDLDVKKKGVSNLENDDINNQDNRTSPNLQKQKLLKTSGNGQDRDYLRGQQSSGSSGNESPSSSHSIKPENDEYIVSKQDDLGTSHLSNESSSSSSGNGTILNGSIRCIASVFSGHAKLKRLLGTLVQFANNISNETGDTVRTLVLGLLSGGITAEEFHSALQEATNFPLRDFVLPYLRHTLPSLRRNLNAAARANNQTCVQFLRANESAVLETVNLVPSGETVELFGDNNTNGNSNASAAYNASRSGTNSIQNSNPALVHHHYSGATNLATKRRASDTLYYENGGNLEDTPVYGKRSNNPWSHHAHQQHQQSDLYCWYQPVHSSSSTTIQNPGAVPPNLVQINQLSSFGIPSHPPSSQQQQQQQQHHQQQQQQQQQQQHVVGQNGLTLDDEWKNIHVMLNCILGMVEKTKRALVILQRRGCSSPATAQSSVLASTQNGNSNGNNITIANSSQIESGATTDRDSNLKRLSGEIVAQTIRATEDRVAAEVKRRAEEAVQEVKRVAMAEVQRAIATAVAESRASERLRVHQLLDLPTAHRGHRPLRQGFMRLGSHSNQNDNSSKTTSAATSSLTCDDEKDATHITSGMSSNCWNCGRPALETCGGCGIARYCGSFCQHRDWESGGHHATCNSSLNQETRRSSSQSPPRIGSSVLGSTTDVDSGTTIGKGK